MAATMEPTKKKRVFWWQLANPPRCSQCNAALVAYSSPAQSQYRKCPNGCGETSKNSRK